MKILLTGAAGQFGRDFQRIYGQQHEIVPVDAEEMDIRDLEAVLEIVRESKPSAIVHAAAYTQVDRAETDPDGAFAVNALGSRNVAMAAEDVGAWLFAISTDYVFSGRQGKPYHEFDETRPASVYGQSKLAGERLIAQNCRRHTIIRTAWLYGTTGVCFPRTIAQLARQRRESMAPLQVVDDQTGNPTSTRVLANLIHLLLDDPIPGIVHGTCEGSTTWFRFAAEILDRLGIPCRLEPCTTEEMPRPAPRPTNSSLDKMVLRLEGRSPMPHWTDALDQWVTEVIHDVV